MGGKRQWDERTYRATWEDVDSWVQAVEEDHRCQVSLEIRIPAPSQRGQAVVDVELFVPGVGSERRRRWRHYRPLDLRAPHHAEHLALQMLSQAWSELEQDKLRAERQATLL